MRPKEYLRRINGGDVAFSEEAADKRSAYVAAVTAGLLVPGDITEPKQPTP